MITLRPLRWPGDQAALLALDTSFTTDRIYQVLWTEYSCALEEVPINPVLHKTYALSDDVDAFPTYAYVVVAEIEARVIGVAALRWEEWNRRAVLQHLYLAPTARGQGVGRMLIDDVVRTARVWSARCLWAETQNINYGAIQFYRRVGFHWCGLDRSLYDANGSAATETALFFARDLAAFQMP